MKVVSSIQEKGGVGKTVTSITIGSGLAMQGLEVLVVDGDPQGHATISLGEKKFDGLFRLLQQGAEWGDVTRRIDPQIWASKGRAKGNLYLMPGHVNNSALPMLIEDDALLVERMDELDNIDVVIFDTSPTPSRLHGMIYLASNYIYFPTLAEFLAMDGLASSYKHMLKGNASRLKQGLSAIELLGVQIVQFDNTTNHKDNYELMIEQFGAEQVWQPIARRTVWRDANQNQKSIFAYEAQASHEKEALAVAQAEAWSLTDKIIEGMRLNG